MRRAVMQNARNVFVGQNTFDALKRQRPARVDALDLGVRHGAALDLPVQHARQGDVACILRAAGHLLEGVVTFNAGADDTIGGRMNRHRGFSWRSRTISSAVA